MSSSLQRTVKTGTTNVISFPLKQSDTTSVGSVDEPANPFDNPEYELNIKSLLESVIFEAWVKTRFEINKADDPFDAIYLAELTPDNINTDDLNRIAKYSSIQDLSDTIEFDDGWDD